MMKEYYKADNELVKQVIDYFSPESDGRLIRKEFEIGGRTWLCTGSGWMTNHGSSFPFPTDARMTGEIELTQSGGKRHPQITLTINVGSGH